MDAADLKIQLARRARACCESQLLDLSGMVASEAAIYALSDPRDISVVCYVGQTRSPRRRLLQHINTARLWLPVLRISLAAGAVVESRVGNDRQADIAALKATD